VSSIRLFVLGALAERGEMHGHQLRLLAEQEHVDLWTDITVGGLYAALKRLAAEDLIEAVRTEREGGYPERQVWRITTAGRTALGVQLIASLREIVMKPDPFDLAMTRVSGAKLDELPTLMSARVAMLEALHAEQTAHVAAVTQYLTLAEQFVMKHRLDRIAADIAWHRDLIAHLPEIIRDKRSREDTT
jgi:DNA-binding PadR family transcriptional regulator